MFFQSAYRKSRALVRWWTVAFLLLVYSLWFFTMSSGGLNWEPPTHTQKSVLPGRVAFATVLGSDDYLVGVAVLRRSLKLHHPALGHSVDFVVLCTTAVSHETLTYLNATGAHVLVVPEIPNPYDPHTRFLGSFAKLYLWNLTNYDQVVYLDADCYVDGPLDHLFQCERFCFRPNRPLSHQPDACAFNSGVMVLRPSTNKFHALLQALNSRLLPSDDRADQGFLNSFHYYDCMSIVPDPDSYGRADFATQLELAITLTHDYGHSFPAGCAALSMVGQRDRARCQLLPYEYNFDVRSRMVWWSYWLFGVFTRAPVVAQFTGPFKPWDCRRDQLTVDQYLTCAQPLFRKYQTLF